MVRVGSAFITGTVGERRTVGASAVTSSVEGDLHLAFAMLTLQVPVFMCPSGLDAGAKHPSMAFGTNVKLYKKPFVDHATSEALSIHVPRDTWRRAP